MPKSWSITSLDFRVSWPFTKQCYHQFQVYPSRKQVALWRQSLGLTGLFTRALTRWATASVPRSPVYNYIYIKIWCKYYIYIYIIYVYIFYVLHRPLPLESMFRGQGFAETIFQTIFGRPSAAPLQLLWHLEGLQFIEVWPSTSRASKIKFFL